MVKNSWFSIYIVMKIISIWIYIYRYTHTHIYANTYIYSLILSTERTGDSDTPKAMNTPSTQIMASITVFHYQELGLLEEMAGFKASVRNV